MFLSSTFYVIVHTFHYPLLTVASIHTISLIKTCSLYEYLSCLQLCLCKHWGKIYLLPPTAFTYYDYLVICSRYSYRLLGHAALLRNLTFQILIIKYHVQCNHPSWYSPILHTQVGFFWDELGNLLASFSGCHWGSTLHSSTYSENSRIQYYFFYM